MSGPTTAFQSGVHGSRPAASAGCVLYWCTTHSILYRSDGSTWATLADLSASAHGAWTDYTPTIGSSGTPPTLGSSTIQGRYKQLDSKTYAINIEFNVTTGGAWNPGTGVYTFSLPSGLTTVASRRQALTAHLNDASTIRYVGSAVIAGGATVIALVSVYTDAGGATGFGATTPLTLATGDYLIIQGIIEVA